MSPRQNLTAYAKYIRWCAETLFPSGLKENPSPVHAVKQLSSIFGNQTLDYKSLKLAIKESGFKIHSTEPRDILAVNFNEHVIIDLRAEEFDLTRLDYKPKKKE